MTRTTKGEDFYKFQLIDVAHHCITNAHWRGELENQNGNLDESEVTYFLKEVEAAVLPLVRSTENIVWEEK